MLDAALAFANTKAGAALASSVGAAFSAPPLNSSSGGGVLDGRGFMDGSGWTVSTGSSKASGGDISRPSVIDQAGGVSGMGAPAELAGGWGLAAVVVLAVVMLRGRK